MIHNFGIHRMNIKQELTVEEGYHISLTFFNEMWPLVEQNIQKSEEIITVNELFFCVVCIGEEASTEWKQAVLRAKKIPNEELRNVKLTEEDVFLCAIEFCKLHNERWEGKLDYTLHLLESMKSHLEHHPKERRVWKWAMKEVLIRHMKCGHFYW